MKKLLLITIGFLFFLGSCLGNDTYFQGLSFEEELIIPSSLDVAVESKEEKEEIDDEMESFVLNDFEKPQVDILILADTSRSMYHHLNKLGESLSHLLSVISDYDWQIAFTTADHGDHSPKNIRLIKIKAQQKWISHQNVLIKTVGGDSFYQPSFGRLMRLDTGKKILKQTIIKKGMKDYKSIFYHTLSHDGGLNCNRPPYCSGGLEQPLRSLKSSIDRYRLDNKPFFRPNAHLVTLIITNEDERDMDSKRATQAIDVLNTFDTVFAGLNKHFINFNILVKDNVCKKREVRRGQIANIGQTVGKLATLTGGVNIDICSNDYGPQLEQISKHIKINLDNIIVLNVLPVQESVQIDFGNSQTIPWSITGKKIVFKGKTAVKTPIFVYYKAKK